MATTHRFPHVYGPPLRAFVTAISIAAASVSGPAAAAGVEVEEGDRRVSFHPARGEGSYVRIVFVRGAHRERVVAAPRGPATGPAGFAPRFVSSTPVEHQLRGDTVEARDVRLAGLPAAMGATVSGRFTPDGMQGRMRDGITSGDFRILVGPERRLADGSVEVRVTEDGRFTVLAGRPRSVFWLPASMMANLTPLGWILKAAGGTAVARAHIGFFALEDVPRARLGAGHEVGLERGR